jgi:hypothetical protein
MRPCARADAARADAANVDALRHKGNATLLAATPTSIPAMNENNAIGQSNTHNLTVTGCDNCRLSAVQQPVSTHRQNHGEKQVITHVSELLVECAAGPALASRGKTHFRDVEHSVDESTRC